MLIAIYGAALSSFNLYLRWKDRIPKIRTKIERKTLGTNNFIRITCINGGNAMISLTESGVIYVNEEKFKTRLFSHITDFSSINDSLPRTLNPQTNIEIDIILTLIVSNAKEKGLSGDIKVTGFVEDALGNEYSSESQITIKI